MWVLNILVYGVLGLIIGSFLNVVIHRLPIGQSVSTPRSHCPECKHVLRPWELIPVVSYLLLNRKCSQCRMDISWRYPGVEILTGVLFILTRLLQPNQTNIGIVFDLVFVSLLVALTMIDIDTFRLPDILVGYVAAAGLLKIIVLGEPTFWSGLIGALGAGGVFFLITYFYPEGMGLGDVKLVAALGVYLGYPSVFYVIFLASLFGVFLGGINFLLRKKSLRDPIPFGPFLAGGSLVVLLGKDYFSALYTFLFL